MTAPCKRVSLENSLPGISNARSNAPAEPIQAIVADDEPHIRDVIAAIVRALGGEVVATAASGEEAVALFERLRPPVVILDINMPGMRGDEALARILALEPGTVAIMMTAQDTIESVRRCLDSGAASYILKNNPAEEILSLLAECWPAPASRIACAA